YVREGDDRRDHRARLAVVHEAVDQPPVELDDVQGQVARQAQRGLAGADVVQRDQRAQAPDVGQRRAYALEVAQHRLLADLDAQRACRQAHALERRAHPLREVDLGQLPGGEV